MFMCTEQHIAKPNFPELIGGMIVWLTQCHLESGLVSQRNFSCQLEPRHTDRMANKDRGFDADDKLPMCLRIQL